jgi:hypothetical protein
MSLTLKVSSKIIFFYSKILLTTGGKIRLAMKNSLLNIKGVSCAAINAGIKHAQNSKDS